MAPVHEPQKPHHPPASLEAIYDQLLDSHREQKETSKLLGRLESSVEQHGKSLESVQDLLKSACDSLLVQGGEMKEIMGRVEKIELRVAKVEEKQAEAHSWRSRLTMFGAATVTVAGVVGTIMLLVRFFHG